MITDLTSLYNLALNAVGSRDNISHTAEASREAEVCNLWYPVVRDQVLRAASWPSCRRTKRLAVLATASGAEWAEGMPDPGFSFAYGTPADMLYPRYLSDFTRFEVSTTPSGTSKTIQTNTTGAILIYTYRNELISMWESSLQMAIVYGLAANVAMPLTGKINRATGLINNANDLIFSARAEAANENNSQMESIPDWIAVRGYANPGDTRFYYPFGPMLTLSAGIVA